MRKRGSVGGSSIGRADVERRVHGTVAQGNVPCDQQQNAFLLRSRLDQRRLRDFLRLLLAAAAAAAAGGGAGAGLLLVGVAVGGSGAGDAFPCSFRAFQRLLREVQRLDPTAEKERGRAARRGLTTPGGPPRRSIDREARKTHIHKITSFREKRKKKRIGNNPC